MQPAKTKKLRPGVRPIRNGRSDGTQLAPDLLIRPVVRRLEPYTPGEQPRISGLIKLNTNENPYGPAPEVLRALTRAIDSRLRLYPSPTAEPLREKLAAFHNCVPENIIVGNGSDELLALATRAFVEPLIGLTEYALQHSSAHRLSKRRAKTNRSLQETLAPSRYVVQCFHPSYSLYPVLAAMHGAWTKTAPLTADFTLPSMRELSENGWDFHAALSFITTPNAPTGTGFPSAALDELCRAQRGVVVLDEAYVDFASESAMALALKHPHVLVARTFSKAYALCALRVGYYVGHPDLIGALQKIRDSYNVNGLGQVAAEATLEALPYYRQNFKRIIASRESLSVSLQESGFQVYPSEANFILVRPPKFSAELWLQKLRDRKILVRWFSAPDLREHLRISVGSETEVRALVRAARAILSKGA